MNVRRPRLPKRSRGAILPLTAIGIVALCGMVALSVDLGMYAVARAQCQDAADAAAVAGARYLERRDGEQSRPGDRQCDRCGDEEHDSRHADPRQRGLRPTWHLSLQLRVADLLPEFPPSGTDNYNLTEVDDHAHVHDGIRQRHRFPEHDGHGEVDRRPSPPRRGDGPRLLRLDEQRKRSVELRDLPGIVPQHARTIPIRSFRNGARILPRFSPLATMQCTSSSSMVGKCNVTTAVLRNSGPGQQPVPERPRLKRRRAFSAASVVDHEHGTGRRSVSQQERARSTPARDLAGHHRQQPRRPSPVTPLSREARSTATNKDPATGARRSSSGLRIPTRPMTGERNSSS